MSTDLARPLLAAWRLLPFGLLCAVATMACGSAEPGPGLNGGGGDDDSGSSQTAASGGPATSTGAGGGSSTSGTGTGGAGDVLAVCLPACDQPADCATAGVAIYDASHYACDAGLCTWLGCVSNAECQSTFNNWV